jgi:fucose 4-O-acetylase-like acetyltransferase
MLPPASLPDPLRAMGECSLAIYILHSIIIAWCIQPLHLLLPLPQFLLFVIAFIGGMCAFAYLLRRLRPAAAGRSLVVRFLMGG